jgi:hypothetical protein
MAPTCGATARANGTAVLDGITFRPPDLSLARERVHHVADEALKGLILHELLVDLLSLTSNRTFSTKIAKAWGRSLRSGPPCHRPTVTYGVNGMVCRADSRQTVSHASKVPLRH